MICKYQNKLKNIKVLLFRVCKYYLLLLLSITYKCAKGLLFYSTYCLMTVTMRNKNCYLCHARKII